MDFTTNNNQTIANRIGTLIWVHGTYHPSLTQGSLYVVQTLEFC